MEHIETAILLAGGKSALARAIGTSPQAVHNWSARGAVPPEFAPLIEQATGVRAELLCPRVPWHVIRGDEPRTEWN